MASIRKRGRKYHVQIRRAGQRSLTRSFQTYRDASAWAWQAELQADRHDLPPDPKQLKTITLGQLVARYRDSVSPHKKTGAYEQLMLNAFLRRPICRLRISDLHLSDFAAYRDQRLRKIKASSLTRELVPIRTCSRSRGPNGDCRYARAHWRISQSRAAMLAESGGFDLVNCSACRKQLHNRAISSYSRSFCLRWSQQCDEGEILALKWDHIDYRAKSLLIADSKNGYPRLIPLFPDAARILKAVPRTNERVFRVTGNALRLARQRLRTRAGMQDLHFHDLRHEAISRFFELGLSVSEVALISGHRDPRMLFRYTHPLRERSSRV